MRAVGALILAAGGSSRLGKPKQLLSFNGQTLIARAAQTALEAGCDPVVVVLGFAAEETQRAVAALPVKTITNDAWEAGMGGSIATGIGLLRTFPVDAAILMVCDQPLVSTSVLRSLIQTWETTEKPIVAASYGNTVGVPCLFHRLLFEELALLRGTGGAKNVIKAHQVTGDVTCIAFPEGEIDVDTPADWEPFSQTVRLSTE